jgi:exosortase
MDRKQYSYLVLYSLFVFFLYGSVLTGMVSDWWNDSNFSHGFLIVPAAGYLIWARRERYRSLEIRGSYLGFIFILFSGVSFYFGEIGSLEFATRLSFLLWIYGSVIVLFGASLFRAILFPMILLLFMIPPPFILYDQIAFPLRVLASTLASTTLNTIGIPAYQEGNTISLSVMKLDIADACSGVRSLASLLALGAIIANIWNRKNYVRPFVFLSAIPIAVLTNSARIIMTGVLVGTGHTDFAEGVFHAFSGWMVFVIGMILIFSVSWMGRILENLTDENDCRT